LRAEETLFGHISFCPRAERLAVKTYTPPLKLVEVILCDIQ